MVKRPLAFGAVVFFLFLVCGVGRGVGDQNYAGSESCMECHEDIAERYARSPHGIGTDPRSPAALQGCETCHGPAAGHVEEGGGKESGGLMALGDKSPAPPGEKNAACLQCHLKRRQALWHGSVHDLRGLACSSCHLIHGTNRKSLARPSQTDLCNTCHPQTKAQLLLQSHHPLREEKMTCGDCHNPHGAVADRLIDANEVNLKCFECHADKRGPFLWAHPPVVENCLTCHTPHGSTHSPLLNSKTPYLCQRCHSNVSHPGQLYARKSGEAGQSVYRVLNNRAFYRACLNCHVPIHGSNHPSGMSLLR